mmetsp:Transcript_44668/g.97269  ORF Transcript_44668/g.97269 Transcript_44668/m.97269 type:complete len:91 (+) Transcript_44668:317-589(+)
MPLFSLLLPMVHKPLLLPPWLKFLLQLTLFHQHSHNIIRQPGMLPHLLLQPTLRLRSATASRRTQRAKNQELKTWLKERCTFTAPLSLID